MDLEFSWDPRKERANHRKHGVTFSEATSVFADPFGRIFADEDHSHGEFREIIIGNSMGRRLLLVCFTESPVGRVRIISARRATKREKKHHEDNVRP